MADGSIQIDVSLETGEVDKGLKGLDSSLKSASKSLTNIFKQGFFSGMKDQLSEVYANIESMGSNVAKLVEKPLGSIANTAATCINSIVTQLNSGPLKGALENVGQILSDMIKTVTSLANAVLPALSGSVSFLTNAFGGMIPVAASAFAGFKVWGQLKEPLDNTISKFSDMMLGLNDYSRAVQTGASAQQLLLENMSASQLLMGAFTGQIKLSTAATQLFNNAWKSNPLGVIVTAVLAATAAISGLLYVLDAGGRAARETVQENAEAVTSFSDAIEGAKTQLSDYSKLLSESGRTAGEIDDQIKNTEEQITQALQEAIQSQKGLRDEDLQNIRGYMDELQTLQDEKLSIYRDNQLAALTKLNLETGHVTQEGLAQALAEAQTSLEEANKVTEEQYTSRLTTIENKYKAMGQVGSAAYAQELQEAKAAHDSDIAENQRYYTEALQVASTNSQAFVQQDAETWATLSQNMSKFTNTSDNGFTNVLMNMYEFGGNLNGVRTQYSQTLAGLDLDATNAFMTMALSVKESGGTLDAETQQIVTNILASFAGLPGGMDEAGKDALLGIVKGMDSQIPELENASSMSANEIATTLAEELEIELPKSKNFIETFIPDMLGSMGDKFKEGFNTVGDKIKEFCTETVPNWFGELPDKIGNAIGGAIGTLAKWGSEIGDWASTEIPNLINGIVEWWSGLPESIGNWWNQTLENIKQWPTMVSNWASTAIPNLCNQIGDWWNGLVGKIKEIGSNIITGFWSGINEKWEWLKGQISSFGSSVLQGFKNAFKIASPSKLMRDEVGKMIALGVAEGIEENAEEATEAFDNLVEGLDYLRDFDAISEAEYYKRLEQYRDEYLTHGTKEWMDATAKLYKYRKDQADKEADRLEQEYKDGKLSAENYYAALQQIQAGTFKENTEAWEEYTERMNEIVADQLAVLDDYKQEVADLWAEMAESAWDNMDEVLAAQDKLASKLKDYGQLYDTITFQGVGFSDEALAAGNLYRGEDGTVQAVRLHDISADISALREYRDALLAVKNRGNVPPALFAALRDMSIEEGTRFAKELARVGDDEFSGYIAQWQAKQDISDDIAETLYADERADAQKYIDEAEAVGADIMAMCEEMGLEIPETFLESGQKAGENFAAAFQEKLGAVLEKAKEMVTFAMGNLMPVSVQTAAAGLAAGGGSSAVYQTANYNFYSSGETTSQQIAAAKAAAELDHTRGIV